MEGEVPIFFQRNYENEFQGTEYDKTFDTLKYNVSDIYTCVVMILFVARKTNILHKIVYLTFRKISPNAGFNVLTDSFILYAAECEIAPDLKCDGTELISDVITVTSQRGAGDPL